jgi:hypothetical protein
MFRSIAARLAEKKLIRVETTENRMTITVPNIMKYRDEYSKKSGHAPDQEQMENRARTDAEGSSRAGPGVSNASPGIRTSPATAPPDWRQDESYGALVVAWRAAKPDAIDEDFARNFKYWIKLDNDQRQQALTNFNERIRAGLQTSSTLKYWLTEDYKRAIIEPQARDGKPENAFEHRQQRRKETLALTSWLGEHSAK